MYFKMSLFKETVYCTVQCTLVHVYVFLLKVKSPCCSGGKSVNNCINILLCVSDRWICSIIRHSKRFSSIEALGAV